MIFFYLFFFQIVPETFDKHTNRREERARWKCLMTGEGEVEMFDDSHFSKLNEDRIEQRIKQSKKKLYMCEIVI